MRTFLASRLVIAFAIVAIAGPASFAQVALNEELGKQPSWKSPSEAEVRVQVLTWLDEINPPADIRQQVLALWPERQAAKSDAPSATVQQPSQEQGPERGTSPQLLQRLVASFAIADARSLEIADLCSNPHDLFATPEFAWLSDTTAPAFVRMNLRLWLGKWLAQSKMYEEALAQIGDLKPADVIDPGSLLFYQSVCHHWMLHKTAGLEAISQLLEQRKAIPRRYEQMAELMQADLNALEDDSLDHISRRMNDVTRRLDFAHAGKRVRGVEDGIIASLDKLIKQMEDQANSSSSSSDGSEPQDDDGQGGQGNPRGIQSTNPASQSRVARGTGPGEVTNKKIGSHSGWGDLPPKEQEKAMQEIGKEFPSHYRDIIEQYFRKLATDEEEK
jgi:hypothetical protein